MIRKTMLQKSLFLLCCCIPFFHFQNTRAQISLDKEGNLKTTGLDVLVFTDNYPEGHQGGIQIIQHGVRVATNGDLWLEPAPGQWSPFSQVNGEKTDPANQTITVSLSYPNIEAAERKFNPIAYTDLEFSYTIQVKAEGKAFRIIVNLDMPLPKEWVGKVGFNLELYPGDLFGKSYYMDRNARIFPQQLNGPFFATSGETFESVPMATGNELLVAPESELQRISIKSEKNSLQLIDGRTHHNNGWFIVRSLVPKGATTSAIEWIVTPHIVNNWKYPAVIHINQVGYFTSQEKVALIEVDVKDSLNRRIELIQVLPDGNQQVSVSDSASLWGFHQRYRYYQFDFTKITTPGIYYISCGISRSEIFRIGDDIYNRNVWQPTLEYFLPVQMCHMRVNDRYRVWHGLCHMDDARMASTNYIHFDGYLQGPSTLCIFKPGEHVPKLNSGGWHDAGDFDLRVESQAGTIYSLSLIYEAFGIDYDITTIDQHNHLVEMHLPDGKPDILQQIEHGAITLVNGYRSLGRLYRGIICNELRQYVTLGDAATITNNLVFNSGNVSNLPSWFENSDDDRRVFTEDNPRHELQVCAGLAASARVLKGYNDTLAAECIQIAEELLDISSGEKTVVQQIEALIELFLTTGKPEFMNTLLKMDEEVVKNVSEVGWAVSRVFHGINDNMFKRGYMLAIQQHYLRLQEETGLNPFGVPFKPQTWGVAWDIEKFGMEHYFLYKNLLTEESKKYTMNALNYLLGMHPGSNTASFISGVGTKSATIAYGLNRDDWSYIPGGVISGTSTIQPDFPELKEWPYLWQQSEYMISGAAENFIFLVLGVQDIMK
jgi:endoglucanase